MDEEIDDGVLTLATQGSITFFGNIVGKFLGFFFVAIATRLVTPTEYGIYVLGVSIVLFVQGFASLNLYRAVDYFVPRFLHESNYGQAKKILLNVLVIGVTTSIIGAVIVFLFREQIAVLFDKPQLAVILAFLVLVIPLQTVYRILVVSFGSIKKMKYRVAISNIIEPLVKIGGAVLLVAMGAGILGLIGGHLLGITIAVIFGIGFLLYEADWLRGTPSKPVSNWSLVSYSLPLIFAGVIYSLVGQIDYFVIGYYRTSAEVGHYQVGYVLATNLLIVLSAITPVFKPLIAEISSDNSLLQRRYQVATRWVTMLTLPLAITLILAPGVYLSLLFTEEYAVAAAAVVALTTGYLLNASSGPEGMVLEGLGYTRLTLFNSLVLVCGNGILDVLLVPRFGILGAGLATGAALAFTGFIGVLEIYYLRNLHPYNLKLLRVYLATVFPILMGWFIVSLLVTPLFIAILLPPVVLTSYLLGLRLVDGFGIEEVEVATLVDQRIGYPLLRRLMNF